MKVQLRIVTDAIPALQSLADTKLPVKLAYRISRGVVAANRALRDFEKARGQMFRDLGPIAMENGAPKWAEGQQEQWKEKVDALLDAEVDLGELHVIPFSMFEGMSVEGSVLAALCGWLIDDSNVEL